MVLGKLRKVALVLVVGVAGTTGLLTGRAPAEGKASVPKGAVADADLADYVAKRINEWKPTAEERRFDEIAWAKDIREALRLGKAHNRPVFLFTHDGRMNIGRC